MKHSFIFCYRNREEHLKITLPRIRELHPDAEIIVVEQDDNKKFRRANLLNEGAKVATGDILIFHDIDYYPVNEPTYYWHPRNNQDLDVWLPVKSVQFVYNDLTPKPMDEVPGGYRHFIQEVDANFFGAVTAFKRSSFFKINGFSPMFVGWGFEDADLRERIQSANLSVLRSANQRFKALDHPDSGPAPHDPDFNRNMQLAAQSGYYSDRGMLNQPSTTRLVEPKHPAVDIWIMAKDFDGQSYITATSLDWLMNE